MKPLHQQLRDMRRQCAIAIEEHRAEQQATVRRIRRLKKVRRKLNEICDHYRIMLRDDYHKTTLTGADPKQKLLVNTIRKDMVYYISDVNARLDTLIGQFNATSAKVRQLKKDSAQLNKILDS